MEVKSVSGSGLESDIVSGEVRIDKTAPTADYSLSPDTWTTESVTITLFPSDKGGSGLNYITLPDGRTVYDFDSIPFEVFQNGDYRFVIADNAGNVTTVTVTVDNIAILDVTATLGTPFIISPDSERFYSGDISFENHSNVPISLQLIRVSEVGDAPKLVGQLEKDWKNLSATDTKRFIALGLTGNGYDFWLDGTSKNQPHALGRIEKTQTAFYQLKGNFGYARENAQTFYYGFAVKVSIAA